jgi:inhibitor of KinA
MKPDIFRAGDSALLVRFGNAIDPAVNARALTLAERIREAGWTGVGEAVVGYASVTVYLSPLIVEAREIEERITALLPAIGTDAPLRTRALQIGVRYGGEYGPDLEEVAAFAHCTADEVVRLHASRAYRVFMVGFVPGFPYMASVDDRIAMPRRDTPRQKVPALTVGIAGRQTGIYPIESPGGWRLIGRTDQSMFDAFRPEPSLLQPGDTVHFHRMK